MKIVNNMALIALTLLISGCSHNYQTSRSPLRKKDPSIPQLTTCWHGESMHYSRSSSHYEKYPLFEIFDQDYFDAHTIPDQIANLENNAMIPNISINAMIEELLDEIKAGKKTFTNFIVLQKKNFNIKKQCGLIVLRFREYPFVLKLFMETPETFVDPYCKGVEPAAFFFMAGGTNRHISGLTRIYNLEWIQEQLQTLPQWSVHLPRKWFWAPKNNRYIEIVGTNIDQQSPLKTLVPSIYGIIADAIEIKENHTLSKKNRNDLIMKLCTDLNFYIDPHGDNYIVTCDTTGKHTIHLLDTEHFPSMVGIHDPVSFDSYTSWYLYLAGKCATDAFFRLKNTRKLAHTKPRYLQLPHIKEAVTYQEPLAQYDQVVT